MDRARFITIVKWWREPWGLKTSVEAVAVAVVLFAVLSTYLGLGPQKKLSSGCQFPAMYNFGDSNSDTGSFSATFYRLPAPYSYTYFGKPSGRFSDGRNIIDFIAQRLDFPFLSAYIDSMGANFRYGANFAIGASTIQPLDVRIFEERYSSISLNVQLSQFAQLKACVNELFPRDIRQNGLNAGLNWKPADQVLASVSTIAAQLALTIEIADCLICAATLPTRGKSFLDSQHRSARVLASTLPYKLPEPDDLDQNGSLKPYNEVVQEFNVQLKRVLK